MKVVRTHTKRINPNHSGVIETGLPPVLEEPLTLGELEERAAIEKLHDPRAKLGGRPIVLKPLSDGNTTPAIIEAKIPLTQIEKFRKRYEGKGMGV